MITKRPTEGECERPPAGPATDQEGLGKPAPPTRPERPGRDPFRPRPEFPRPSAPSDWWCVRQEPAAGDDKPEPESRRGRTVVISDIHIGNNTKTCWYQSALHDNYLASLLDYVIAHARTGADPITRLVILGDLFDFWTYPPEQRPPTIDDIIAANPRILGPKGKLSQAIEALDGNAIYLRGNHDIEVTQAVLNHLPLGKHKIPLVDSDVLVDKSGLVLTHGHLFTMFNAPDPRYPGEMPVGHFVTRAIAHMLEHTLGPNQTAASLTNQGSPYGFSLDAFVPALMGTVPGPSITNLMLDYFAARCGLPESTPILLSDGSRMSIAQAKKKYDGLWDIWVDRYGGGFVGETIAAKAVKADYNGDYMAWFSQKTAWDHGARGAVTGHTHVPRQGIENSSLLYLNCGFECPSEPDIVAGSGVFNFGVIDVKGVPGLWCVKKGDNGMYCVGPVDDAPADQLVYAPFLDYSCYVTIENHGSKALERVRQSADQGFYVTYPPASIAPGTTGRFWLQDVTGPFGAEGEATYAIAGGGKQLKFTYGCPTILPNYAKGGSSVVASSNTPPDANTPANSVPPFGHPLFANFKVDDRTGTGVVEWTPQSVLAHAVVAAGFWYDPSQDIIYSRMYPLQRIFGYAYGYDAMALLMNAIIDCEPIFFEYNGKTWMIELWKGQYGLETGCEIGVYNRPIGSSNFLYDLLDDTIGRRTGDSRPSHNQFFDCVTDEERLVMSSKLYRNGQELFSRGPERHWWLTGFKWGVLSEPEDLTMDVSIECLDGTMKNALVNALSGMGYTNVQTTGNTVKFKFDSPKTHQPRADTAAAVSAIRVDNQLIVSSYNSLGLTSNDPNTVGDQAAATIGNSFAIYGEAFFAAVIASFGNLFGQSVQSVLRALADGFDIAFDAASQFITDAGYTLASWVDGIGDWIEDAFDFSCVIEIRGAPHELVREDFGIGHGNWGVRPPRRIAAGGSGRFLLRDNKPSLDGSDGWVTYSYINSSGSKRTVTFEFNDPTGFSSNTASSSSSSFNLYAKSGNANGAWNRLNEVPGGGHPLYVTFVWGNPPPPPP